MPHYERHFTLAEARALLPELRRTFARIHRLLEAAEKRRSEKSEKSAPLQFFSANGQEPRMLGDGGEETGEIQRILNEVHAKGVLVKDLRRGLCDFPYFLPPDETEVLLCWELCEADIGYWHALDSGYSGRAPLGP